MAVIACSKNGVLVNTIMAPSLAFCQANNLLKSQYDAFTDITSIHPAGSGHGTAQDIQAFLQTKAISVPAPVIAIDPIAQEILALVEPASLTPQGTAAQAQSASLPKA